LNINSATTVLAQGGESNDSEKLSNQQVFVDPFCDFGVWGIPGRFYKGAKGTDPITLTIEQRLPRINLRPALYIPSSVPHSKKRQGRLKMTSEGIFQCERFPDFFSFCFIHLC
jgi:hypothetical protein